jgi:hypothetical protein
MGSVRQSVLRELRVEHQMSELDLYRTLVKDRSLWFMPRLLLRWQLRKVLRRLVKDGRVQYLRSTTPPRRKDPSRFEYSLATGEMTLTVWRRNSVETEPRV